MYLSRRRTSPSDETEITFPLLECWNPMTKMATIAVEVNKQRVLCRISLEVLQERFSAAEEEPMQAVADNRSVLQAAAKKLIEDGTYEEDGSLLIRPDDL